MIKCLLWPAQNLIKWNIFLIDLPGVGFDTTCQKKREWKQSKMQLLHVWPKVNSKRSSSPSLYAIISLAYWNSGS